MTNRRSSRRTSPLPYEPGPGVEVPTLEELISKAQRYGITKKTVYTTEDGVAHETFNAAVKHIDDTELRVWLYEFMSSVGTILGISENNQSELVQHLTSALRHDWLITKRPTKEEGHE